MQYNLQMSLEELFVRDVKYTAKLLRRAKEAHTVWERQFEGNVPKHDWEVWYAQWMLLEDGGRAAGLEPLSITKLQTLVGPL